MQSVLRILICLRHLHYTYHVTMFVPLAANWLFQYIPRSGMASCGTSPRRSLLRIAGGWQFPQCLKVPLICDVFGWNALISPFSHSLARISKSYHWTPHFPILWQFQRHLQSGSWFFCRPFQCGDSTRVFSILFSLTTSCGNVNPGFS